MIHDLSGPIGDADAGTPTGIPDVAVGDTGAGDAGSGEPEPGEFGAPCSGPEDCYSGWCVVAPEGLVCSKACSKSFSISRQDCATPGVYQMEKSWRLLMAHFGITSTFPL